jgi:UDP-N-acetylglucosamine 2-epimerase
MFKVMTVVGTRPEIIKLSEVIRALDVSFAHTLVHTGQHYDYELSQVFFDDLGVRQPDVFLGVTPSRSAMEGIAQVFVGIEQALDTVRPDAMLVYGDTNSCLCAYVAKRKRIPIFHMEAGNRCFDARVPEEVNRKIIDHLADVNMTITEHARRNLMNEGFPSNFIFKVGSSMEQILARHAHKIDASEATRAQGLTPRDFILLSIHREENVTRPDYMSTFHVLLKSLASRFGVSKVLLSAHPRTRKALDAYEMPESVQMTTPFGFFDYMRLQKDALCVISDSGTIMEESALCGFPAVTIRDAYERQEGMDAGVLIVSNWDVECVINAVRAVLGFDNAARVLDYSGGNVAQKVVAIISSHIHIINAKVYGKP